MTPVASPLNPDLLIQADLAERKGDRMGAVSKLRAHLTAHPDDGAVRLRLGRLLVDLGEPSSARGVLLPLDHGDNDAWARQANRLLATLDEAAGALTSARIRWERVLADDVDDPEAQHHARRLGPDHEFDRGPAAPLVVGTLASPEGVHLSRFKLLRELGRGASAAVYLVRDERLNLPLALKVLHPQFAAAARTEAREKFFAEARLAMRLRHPGVVAVYDVDEGARCLAMEYIEGGTVRDRLRAGSNNSEAPAGATPGGGVDSGEVLATARSLLTALAYVHGAGIIHGDLKPGNLLLRRPTEVVLADFGGAQFTTGAAPPHERTTGGTPLYLAPEQFHGAPPSVRTDLFAAGAILWEMLRGHPARRQSDLFAGNYAVPVSVGSAQDSASSHRLVSLIDALTATSPEARPAHAAAALGLLDP